MKHTIDMRNKTCPLPVIETKKKLAATSEGDCVVVDVDNFIAVQNLQKMAEQKKLHFSWEQRDTYHYQATFSIGEVTAEALQENTPVQAENTGVSSDKKATKTVVILASDVMGEGDPKLGHLLMKGFVYALTEQDSLPTTVLLYNKGAYLSTEASDCVADLKLLEEQGVEILTCGTCLNHYGLADKLAVGSATNMYVIVEKQMEADKLIKP